MSVGVPCADPTGNHADCENGVKKISLHVCTAGVLGDDEREHFTDEKIKTRKKLQQ